MTKYLIFSLVIAIAAFLTLPQSLERRMGDVPFEFANVKRGKIVSRLSTIGRVSPIRAVTVSTQVSATIESLKVNANSGVKEGQGLASFVSLLL